MAVPRPTWQAVAQSKQDELWLDVPRNWRVALAAGQNMAYSQTNIVDVVPTWLSASERFITDLPVCRLLESLSNGDITAQEALTAFAHRAVVANHYVRLPASREESKLMLIDPTDSLLDVLS